MVHFINALIIVLLLGLSTLLGKAQTKNANTDFDRIILNAYHQDQTNRSRVEKVLENELSPRDTLQKYAIELKRNDLINQQTVFPILDQYLANHITLREIMG